MLRRLLPLLLVAPILLSLIGLGLNTLAVTANNGMMPATYVPAGWTEYHLVPGQVIDRIHIVWAPGMHLKLLCDWIYWLPHDSIASPGDLFLWLGDWVGTYYPPADFCLGAALILAFGNVFKEYAKTRKP